MAWRLGALVLLTGLTVGCVQPTSDGTTGDTPEATAVPVVPAATPPAPGTPEIPGVTSGNPVTPPDAGSGEPAAASASPPAPRGGSFVPAEAGVAKQGRSLDNESGVLVTSAKALFTVREKAVFEIQIPQALQLFKGVEGRAPQSHEEFMEKIVNANSIRLPELPAGQRYVYDPQREELMVERPAPQ